MLAAVILQSTVISHIKIAGVKPDLVLMLVAFFAMFQGLSGAIEAAFFGGVLTDILSSGIMGMNIFILSVTAVIASALSSKFFKESAPTHVFLVFIISSLSMSARYAVSTFMERAGFSNFPEYLFQLILPSSVYTAALSAILFPVLINKLNLRKREEYI